jgi:hypothetical protein
MSMRSASPSARGSFIHATPSASEMAASEVSQPDHAVGVILLMG